MENLEGEVWEDIPKWGSFYQASTLGRIRTWNGSVKGHQKKLEQPKILKQSLSANGYLAVCLRKNGKGYAMPVHQLVATTFIPNIENKECINHIDHNPLNNHVDNLEWVTRAENNAHGLQNKNTKSKYLGVSFKEFARVGKRKKPWFGRLYNGKKQIFVGYFATDYEAHLANEAKRKELGIVNKYSKPKGDSNLESPNG